MEPDWEELKNQLEQATGEKLHAFSMSKKEWEKKSHHSTAFFVTHNDTHEVRGWMTYNELSRPVFNLIELAVAQVRKQQPSDGGSLKEWIRTQQWQENAFLFSFPVTKRKAAHCLSMNGNKC